MPVWGLRRAGRNLLAGRPTRFVYSCVGFIFPFRIYLNHFSGSCARGEVLLRMSNPILDNLQTVDFDFDGILSSNFAVLSGNILPNCLGKSLLDLRTSMNVFLDYYVSKFFLIESGIVLSAPIWYLGNTDSDIVTIETIVNVTNAANLIILAQDDLNIWAALLKLLHVIRIERPMRHYVRKGLFKLINHMILEHVAHISCTCGNFIISASVEGVQIKMYNNAIHLAYCAMLTRTDDDDSSFWTWQCIDYRHGGQCVVKYPPGCDVSKLIAFIEYSKRHLLNIFCQLGAPTV